MQINLNEKEINKNKEFMNELFRSEKLSGVSKYFTRINEKGIGKNIDKKMTLENYLNLINPSFHQILQIGSPYHDEIRYCVKGYEQQVTRLAWVTCPLNKKNYKAISDIYLNIYGEKIGKSGLLFIEDKE